MKKDDAKATLTAFFKCHYAAIFRHTTIHWSYLLFQKWCRNFCNSLGYFVLYHIQHKLFLLSLFDLYGEIRFHHGKIDRYIFYCSMDSEIKLRQALIKWWKYTYIQHTQRWKIIYRIRFLHFLLFINGFESSNIFVQVGTQNLPLHHNLLKHQYMNSTI